MYRSQRFSSEVILTNGLYSGRKGKRYAIEVVIIAEKVPPDGFKGQLR